LLTKRGNGACGDSRLEQNTALTCLRPDHVTEGLHVRGTQDYVRTFHGKVWRRKARTSSGNVQECDASIIFDG
jgi:hypothetical protein